MDATPPTVRTFGTRGAQRRTMQLGDRRIFLTPAVEKSDGGPLSAYSATFGRGERADLPAPYDEVWVVLHGRLRVSSGATETTAGAGDFLHVPGDSPGQVEALENTTVVCVSVPAH